LIYSFPDRSGDLRSWKRGFYLSLLERMPGFGYSITTESTSGVLTMACSLTYPKTVQDEARRTNRTRE